MSHFRISEIRDMFQQDLEQILCDSRQAIGKLMEDPRDDAARSAVWRHGHTLRGLGLQVRAEALARWGGELERLCLIAGDCASHDSQRAGEIFSFVQQQFETWERLNECTIREDFPAADAVFEELRGKMAAELAAHLAEPAPEAAPPPAAAPRPGSAPAPLQKFAPGSAARLRLAAPRLKQATRAPQAEAGSEAEDVQALFRGEVHGYLAKLQEEFALLEKNPALEVSWQEVRRLFHTVKGAAAVLENQRVSAAALRGEELASNASESAEARTATQFEVCVEQAVAIAHDTGFDFLREEEGRSAAEPGDGSPAEAAASLPADDADPELVETFVLEAREQTDALEQAVLRWERMEHPEAQAAAVKRCFHTLKGAANSIGLRAIGLSVHQAEDYLDALSESRRTAPAELFSFLLGTVDEMRRYTRALEVDKSTQWTGDWQPKLAALSELAAEALPAPQAAAASPALPEPAPLEESSRSAVRLTPERLENLLNLIGETVIDRNRVLGQIGQLHDLLGTLKEKDRRLNEVVTTFYDQFEFSLLRDRNQAGTSGRSAVDAALPAPAVSSSGDFSELEFDRYDRFNIVSRSLLEIARDVHEAISEIEGCLSALEQDNDRFTQSSRQFQGQLTALSLVPFESLFPSLERAFRDAAQSEGKDALLAFGGGNVQIDRGILGRIYAPLLHLLRNAVAHGIEGTSARTAAGKPSRGQVRVSSRQLMDRIVVEVSDDGSGVNVDRVRAAAIERGWLPADAGELEREKVQELICRPGFSTAGQVTTVAGRGTGMDVVATEIERLNGTLELEFRPGEGTTWRLYLPLTLLISDAVVVETAGQRFAFLLSHVETGLLVTEPLIPEGKKVGKYMLGEEEVPVYRLSDALGFAGAENPQHAVLVHVGERRAVLLIDRLLGRQEIVVKALDPLTARHPLLNGATLDAEGGVVPIINTTGLLKSADTVVYAAGPVHGARRVQRAQAVANRVPRILVVDDSLSVRKVQEGLIRRLGCEPVLASDGLDGLEKLRASRADLVLTDLEMPRLNGYELISEMRSIPAWSEIPVIVISSRSADKYITRAMQAGAHSFLAKPFSESQLAALLQKHLGWEAKPAEA